MCAFGDRSNLSCPTFHVPLVRRQPALAEALLYSGPRLREARMAQAFRRCSFSEPSELTLGLHGLEAAAIPVSCSPFNGFLSTISLGDITIEIVRGAPFLLFETVPDGRLGFKLILDGSAGASWDGSPVGGSDV